MDTSTALHQLEAMSSDLLSLHKDAYDLGATEVAWKAWQARQAIQRATQAINALDAACVAADV